ncbi:MAG: phytoene/squalene synthase family protein [bacterium]|jgi:phytoene synthase
MESTKILKNMQELYRDTCLECSKVITKRYSTSFSLGIRAFDKKYRYPIYAVYGFVRYADEIVDTFHEFDKELLFKNFKADTYQAIAQKISLNPVLHSFQYAVNKYNIPHDLIEAFLHSMEMDIDKSKYDPEQYNEYIYGSAEVIGLMCLMIFCEGDLKVYENLTPYARSLGAAFQKINFLRDIKSDYYDRGRVYFPNVEFAEFCEDQKLIIEEDIQKDFDHGLEGIKKLPDGARLGVYIAYRYYLDLFKKIKNLPATEVSKKRIRVADGRKAYLFLEAYFKNKFISA